MDYSNVATQVQTKLASVGMTITLKRGTATYAATGVRRSYTAREINGSSIVVGDQEFTIAAAGLAIVPVVGDKAQAESSTVWRNVVLVQIVGPGSVPLAYKLQVR
jgi:hypothetical protein